MRNVAIVLVCLASASHGRRLQSSLEIPEDSPAALTEDQHRWDRPVGGKSVIDPSQALAVFLHSLKPEVGFKPSGSGMRSSMGNPTPSRSHPAELDRRAAMAGAAAWAASAAVGGQPLAALADVKGANEGKAKDLDGINRLLQSYGGSPIEVKDGLKPFASFIGFANPANLDGQASIERNYKGTLLIRFLYPNLWVTQEPALDENGESGTVGANNYGKGDGINFAAYPLPEGEEKLSGLKKKYWEKFITQKMTQGVYEDFRAKKITPVTQPDGKEMVLIDYEYTLNTRADFIIARKGVASAMVANGSVVGMIGETTLARWNDGLGKILQTCIDASRIYSVKAPAFRTKELPGGR